MGRHKQKQAGFSLIELLVVISIFGLLSSVIIVSAKESRLRARDTQRVSNLRQMKTALELYYAEHDIYPTSMSEYGATNFSIYPTWNDLQTEMAPFMASLPHDPTEPTRYFYYFSGPQATWCLPNGGQFLRIRADTGYMLVAFLENPQNTLPQTDGGLYSDRYEVFGGDARMVATCP